MVNINYSFIIPHHNSPELLNRCLDSIPQRDDIEIIVVDDNSDIDKRPVINRADVVFIQIEKDESKGAGRARNFGLRVATGKWLLFSDCDDIYEDGFINVLDKYVDAEDIDVLYYDVYYAWDLKQQNEMWPQKYSSAIRQYLSNKDSKYWLLMVKHIIQAPWNFMLRLDYVKKINAKFEEISKGNDAYFHHYVSMNTNRCEVIPDKVYYWLYNENSITHQKRTREYYMSSIQHNVKIVKILVEAQAWNTIKPFYRGFAKVYSDHGFIFAIRYMFAKAFSGVSWLKIWYNKFVMKISL